MISDDSEKHVQYSKYKQSLFNNEATLNSIDWYMLVRSRWGWNDKNTGSRWPGFVKTALAGIGARISCYCCENTVFKIADRWLAIQPGWVCQHCSGVGCRKTKVLIRARSAGVLRLRPPQYLRYAFWILPLRHLEILQIPKPPQKVSQPSIQKHFFTRKLRSEERHVGKECRSRWSPYH